MKKGSAWLTAAAVGTLLPIASHAADLPVKAKPIIAAGMDWSGVYVGVHAGYGGGMKDWLGPNNGWDFVARGALVGGQVGINKQLGSFVVGVELDGSWADINGSQSITSGGALFGFTTTIENRSRIDGLLTLAGRAGLAADRWFVYAKGGLTAAHERHNYVQNSAFIPAIPLGTSLFISSGEEVRFGPMLGFGTEYALTGNWSIKSEYNLHYLGDRLVGLRGTAFPFLGAPVAPFNFDERIDQTIHTVKIGANYRFGGVAVDPSYPPVPAVPGTNWTGGYVGVQGGYAWGHKEWPNVVPGAANPRYDMTGWLAGGTVGANVQSGSFVFGVEGEILGVDIKGSHIQSVPVGLSILTSTVSSKIDWLALATARAGFVVGSNLLLYGKGGVAIANETHNWNVVQVGVGGSITQDIQAKVVHTGAVVGVGGEYAIAPNWSVKLEYDYVRMLQQRITPSGVEVFNLAGFVGPADVSQTFNALRQDLHLVKFGVNYHFNPVQTVVTKY